jgi:cytochrome c oxidase subunit 4
MLANYKHDVDSTMYLKIFFMLLALTSLTFLQPLIIGDSLHTTVSIQMFLACIKTVLIVAYYMHLKYESILFKIIVLVAVVTLSIFFIITASDAIFRNESFDMFK